MKSFFNKGVAFAMSIVVFSISCTTFKPLPMQSLNDVNQRPHIDPTKNYEVEFNNGQRFELKGDNIQLNKDMIGLRLQDMYNYNYYEPDRFKKISIEQFSWGKTALAAGGIVAVVGLTIFLIVRYSFRESDAR